MNGEELCESDVYRIGDRCIKFYSIDKSYVEQYHELQTYLSQFTGTIAFKDPVSIHPRFIYTHADEDMGYLCIRKITFQCLPLSKDVLEASDIKNRSKILNVADIVFQEGKTLQDMFFEAADIGGEINYPLLDLFFKEEGILDQMRTFYNEKSLKTEIRVGRDKSQLVGINIKIAGFDESTGELSLVITDMGRDIVQLIEDNQSMIRSIMEAKSPQ